MPDPFLRKTWRLRNLGGMPLGLLALLVVLTAAAWALTLYQTFRMDMPMGIAVRGGTEGGAGSVIDMKRGIPRRPSRCPSVVVNDPTL